MPKDETKAEETAGDDKMDVKTEEVKPETEQSTETPTEEQPTDMSAADDDDKNADKSQEEEKPDVKTEQKQKESKDSTETESSANTSAKEIEKNQSEETEKADADTQQVKTPETVEQAPSESSNSHDVYTGEVHDPNINANERHNYRPINIMFRRKCQNPQVRIQFDRTVILKNQTFYLNVDGKNVRLLASPQSIESYDDIKMLLQIVDHINLSNCCVEPISHIS